MDFGALATIAANGGTGTATFAVDVDPGAGGRDVVNNASVVDNSSGATSSDQLTVTVVNPDSDGDGVLDTVDECPNTSLATDAPDSPRKNRFFVDANGSFVDGNGTASGYTIADTRGCSSKQIVEAADLGRGHTRFGLSRSALEAWIS